MLLLILHALKKSKTNGQISKIKFQSHMPESLNKILALAESPQRRKPLETRNIYQMPTGREPKEGEKKPKKPNSDYHFEEARDGSFHSLPAYQSS